MIDHAKADISAKQPSPRENTRLPCTDVNQEWADCSEEASCKGSQTTNPISLLASTESLPTFARLRNTREYRRVYSQGKRYDGRLMVAFVCPNKLNQQRLGITASRKMARKAVERNRSKRLLRESFRLNVTALINLKYKYDWVINAKRSLLSRKLSESLNDLQDIVARVLRDEEKQRL